MKYRLITTFILIALVIAVLFFLPPIGFAFVTLAVCMLSAWEWSKIAGYISGRQRIWFAVFCGLLLTFIMLTVLSYRSFTTVWQLQYALCLSLAWWLVALILVLYYPRSAILWSKFRLLRLALGLLTIFPFFCGMLVIRQHHYDINHFIGAWWLLYVMVLVWGADSGAYIFGRALGRHQLAQKISPGKTWEGLMGGLLTSATIAYLFYKYAPLNAAPLTLFFCSFMTVLASILGDLTESMFKREAGIKDSGKLIPGHGGILDRIDSLTAAVPVFACLMLMVFNAI